MKNFTCFYKHFRTKYFVGKTKLFVLLFLITFSGVSQVSLIKDIVPGPADSNPQHFSSTGGVSVLFSAETGGEGRELWQSFGLAVNTNLLLDINTIGSGIGSDPEKFIIGNGGTRVYFTADDGIHGREPWVFGGPTLPSLFFDLFDGPQGSNITEMTSDDLSNTVFVACNLSVSGNNFGTEIISFPSTNVTNIGNGTLNGEPENLYYDNLNNTLYFSGNNQIGSGKELYSWTGSGQGSLVADINTNPNGDSNPNHFVNLNDKIYFSADNGNSGNELYELDYASGNQVTLVKDIKTGIVGGPSSDPGEKIVYNNKIYFAARSALQGRELWESDGTTAGTQLVLDLNPGTTGSFPENFTVYNNRLYFTATTPGLGLELFYVAPAGNIVLARDIFSGNSDSNPQDLTIYNGKLYFSADDGVNGRELWETDGTSLGTSMTANIHPSSSSNPMDLVVTNDILFFSANDGATGREPWKYVDPVLSLEPFYAENVSIYPNPAKDEFVISSNEDILSISIYNIQGKLVKSFQENHKQYDIEDLTSGLYFVTINTAEGVATKKLIKQ